MGTYNLHLDGARVEYRIKGDDAVVTYYEDGRQLDGDRMSRLEAREDYRLRLKAGYTTQAPAPTPEIGTWAHTARFMAQSDGSGFDWDRWKDERKDAAMGC